MGSGSPVKLPVIDFSNLELKPGTPEWDSIKTQVHQALEEYGCFEALYDKVPLQLRNAIFSRLEELFDLPLEVKLRNTSKKPFHGYVGPHLKIPLFESMGIDDANIPEKAKSFTDLLWPEGNPTFCKSIQSFSEQVSELDQMVRRMVLDSLRVEKYYGEHKESTNYLVRVMKYKASNETKPGLNNHTDMNMMSILCQNQVNRLEVMTKDGEWISVKPSPDSFIVISGDSFHAWTNGRLHSPVHRVMMTGNEVRYSTGLFAIPRAGYMIKAPEELVDEEYPLLFKPFDHVEFLGFYYSVPGRNASSALKDYCAV